MVLGPLMEENLRRALLISRGDWTVFLTRPLSAVLMAMAAFLLVLAGLPSPRKKRDEGFVESETLTGSRGTGEVGAGSRVPPCRLWAGSPAFRVRTQPVSRP